MFKYSINLFWSEKDSCYVATVVEFPGLSALGETPEEAAEEAKIAVEGFLKVYQEDGCPIPKPAILKSFSGQTRLRLPKSYMPH
jgi:predicted RNase H-like HicB family nuclease